MRESIGGSFLLKMILVFFFLFIALLAISINYAQAFRVKNKIIDYIEQYEGYTIENSEGNTAKDFITTYLFSIGYYGAASGASKERGYEVCINTEERNTLKGRIYTVKTYLNIKLPVVGDIIKLPITGQTKFIYRNGVNFSDIEAEEVISAINGPSCP